MLSKNIETFIGCDSEYSESDIVLFGAPFDGTTSFRPGTRFGPSEIRHQSYGLETYSPYQDADLCDCRIFDSGDLELCFGDTVRVLDDIESRTKQILEDGKLPFMVGGEHLVTLGAVRAVFDKYPQLAIVHFDAHADLRDDYLGQKLSHACVLRRCHELVGDGSIYQFGIRSGDRSEFIWQQQGHTEMYRYDTAELQQVLSRLQSRPVHLTVDLDVLDPSVFPGTGTPEAGGIGFDTLRKDVTMICQQLQVVGCDVNELSPAYDPSGVSTAVAGKIIREMLIALANRV